MRLRDRGLSVGGSSLVMLGMLLIAGSSEAATWYVKADPPHPGNGSKSRPFSSLQDLEARSGPGDTLYVIQSRGVLDGGIQLKDGQRLIGLGPKVTVANPHSARATLTNTSGARYDGDVIRLAKNNVVQNIHIDNAFRSSILGINAENPRIEDNLMTNDMAVHDLLEIENEWPNGYILFLPQTNHFGAITLVSCGPGGRGTPLLDPQLQAQSYCSFLGAPGSIADAGTVTIKSNVIRDSHSDGIMLIDDTGVTSTFDVDHNIIKDLSQDLPDPTTVGITDHVVRSRGITLITIDHSVSNLELTNYDASNLSPFGTFAADGLVFLACGYSPLVDANVWDVSISNPFLTGDNANGDSIEIQHHASADGILNVDIRRAHLSDPASTNVKLIDAANPQNGTYNVSISDSVLSNRNTNGIYDPVTNNNGNEDAQIRYSGTEMPQTKAINLTVRNVDISGLGRGIGLRVAPTRTVNTNKIDQLHVLVENSSFEDLTGEAVYWSQSSSVPIGAVGGAIIDLGGGTLGSVGNNRFVNNGVPGNLPPGVNPAGIDPVAPVDGDVSVSFSPENVVPDSRIYLFAEHNYWGGGAPVISTTPGGAPITDIYFTPPGVVFAGVTDYLTVDPQP
ncbi:hypothetical protein [Sorangium sp. So ce381]|uniref:hypothetical protein n=1 Tax=Sorangium sp. So ce381 TaxID=3133307 RepID=UPI003F5BB062